MLLKIRHETRYTYDRPVDYALEKLRLRPLSSAVQTVSSWALEVEGGKIECGYSDHYGNHVDLISTDIGGTDLVVRVEGQVETSDTSGVFGSVYGRAPLWHFQQVTPLTTVGAAVEPFVSIVQGADTVLNGLHALSSAVIKAVPYAFGKTDATTTAEQALAVAAGVCQDHANIFIAAARAAGVPARYVSGYLLMDDRVDQDASHAWAEAHVDGLGWVGFDVSNAVAPDERYVRLAIGRDAADAAPISGMRLGPSDEAMVVTVQVQQ
ncbi:Transglutaminase-like superfamily protein [Sulfitobacter noctilucae]|uniref:transglutaminase family protein n=1 Tax=Sulfitobacter noctilucae TaxID=1342302 RepID=UPI00046A7808|nr:transglutaminase family protein [Sulfitobacter noctilucae]KIN70458.1 Transglutaminase-like superfamily protein [Sulfitobacter noctilucae]